MRNQVLIFLMVPLLISCNHDTNFSGPLDIPDALFSYSAIGTGIPCIAFTGSENIGKNLFPVEFLERFNLIHADPAKIQENIIPGITLVDVVGDIERVRVFLGVEKIAVLGHSMFATLPLFYGAAYPDHLSYGISSGGAPSFAKKFLETAGDYWVKEASDDRKMIFQENLEKFNSMDKSGLSASEVFILEYNAFVPYRFKDPQFDPSPLWEDVEVNIPFIDHYWGNLMVNFEDLELYKKIKAPILAISGTFDFGVPYYYWDAVKDIIPDLTPLVFENAGHNPMLEVPGENALRRPVGSAPARV